MLGLQQAQARRACLRGRRRPLPPGWIYIGRGSRKFGLPPSEWANPFAIGKDGSRDECIQKFAEHLAGNLDLLGKLKDLSGRVLVCHCAEHEPCHADVLIKEFMSLGGAGAEEEDATSDEDELGQPKLPRGSGWLGHGDPVQVGSGARVKGLRDGGGLCSPGRWSPSRRRLPDLGLDIAALLDSVIDEAEHSHGQGFGRRVVCELACGRVSDRCQGG